jgi:hypothetical protein
MRGLYQELNMMKFEFRHPIAFDSDEGTVNGRNGSQMWRDCGSDSIGRREAVPYVRNSEGWAPIYPQPTFLNPGAGAAECGVPPQGRNRQETAGRGMANPEPSGG